MNNNSVNFSEVILECEASSVYTNKKKGIVFNVGMKMVSNKGSIDFTWNVQLILNYVLIKC